MRHDPDYWLEVPNGHDLLLEDLAAGRAAKDPGRLTGKVVGNVFEGIVAALGFTLFVVWPKTR